MGSDFVSRRECDRLPITGWLANYFGRKRLLMSAVVGFTAASFMCGFAPNLAWLVIFRIIQGLTGGVLQPVSQAVMLEAFPPAQRGKAMGFWGLGIVVAPMLGPVLGGWLTDNYSWRWVFYINIPVGIASIIMTKMFIFDPPYIRRTAAKVDTWGIGMLAVGIGALQVVLDKGQQEDWFSSNWIKSLAGLSHIQLLLFIIHELRTKDPVLHLRVFKERTYATGVFLMTTLGFVLYGSLVLLPLFLQTVLGYPAIEAGIAMAPRGLGSFIAMPVVGFLTAKIDPRKLLIVGLIGGAVTLFMLGSLNLQIGYWDIFWPQFFQGLSHGIDFRPIDNRNDEPHQPRRNGECDESVQSDAEHRRQCRNCCDRDHAQPQHSGAIQQSRNSRQFFRYAHAEHCWIRSAAGFVARGMDFTTATSAAYAALSGMVSQQAVMVAFVQLFRILALVFAVVVPLVFIMRKPKAGQAATSAH